MHSSTMQRPIANTAEQRRRRHLSIYHRALRSAKTPSQRAAVAARYRNLFADEADVTVFEASGPVRTNFGPSHSSGVEPIEFPAAQPAVRLAS